MVAQNEYYTEQNSKITPILGINNIVAIIMPECFNEVYRSEGFGGITFDEDEERKIKTSSDRKTLTWYVNSTKEMSQPYLPKNQFNSHIIKYFWVAIG